MIVSHRHKFIFLKPKKVGGTSVELALSALCGPQDIITPTDEEQFRQGLGPQNYIVPYRGWLWRFGFRREGAARPKIVFAPHSRGREVRQHLGREVWNEYLKATILRNPWDREVSRFFWTQGRPNIPDRFEDFVNQVTRKHPIVSEALANRLHKEDRAFLMRYENLASDFGDFVRRLGVEHVPELARAKGQTRPNSAKNYRDVYNHQTREMVYEIYQREIETFGYKF